MYNNKLYIIKTLSNLHVGGSDENYSIVDKQVQKDNLTGYPTVHASSFKGAMREYIKNLEVNKQDLKQDGSAAEGMADAGDGIIYTVFGQEPKSDSTNQKKAKAGHVIFSEPKLLSLPVRTSEKSFMHAICPKLIEMYNDTSEVYELSSYIKEFTADDIGYYCAEDDFTGELVAEEYSFKLNRNEALSVLEDYIGKNVILLSNSQFEVIAKALPVIARNHLENGESKNLFYEEVVPREATFYVTLQYPNDKIMSMEPRDNKSQKNINGFAKNIENIKFYLGANTSIGYGLCELKQISPDVEEKDNG